MSVRQVRVRQTNDDSEVCPSEQLPQTSKQMKTNTNVNRSPNSNPKSTANTSNVSVIVSSNQSNQNFYNNSMSIRQEIQRFESVHPSIYAIYDLLDLITDPISAQQIREHVVCIEGMSQLMSKTIFTPNNRCFICSSHSSHSSHYTIQWFSNYN